MPNFKYLSHSNVYFFAILLLAVSLPVSVFGMSLAQIILVINWAWEGRFAEKFRILKSRKAIWIFLIIFLVHILGLAYTSWPDGFTGASYNALKDIRIKLPLLILPVIIGTTPSLSMKQFKTVLLFFIAAVTINSFISTAVLFGFIEHEVNDIRDISIFISHIRFALLINVAISALWYFIISKNFIQNKYEKTIYIALIIWLIVFLFLLQSLTGLVILFICAYLFFFIWVSYIKNKSIKTASYIVIILLPILVVFFSIKLVDSFYNFDSFNIDLLEKETTRGNPYNHDTKNLQVENGHWVGKYICEQELKKEWNKISKFKYSGKDKKGQYIKYTLIRYLSSKNLRKDADGVKALDKSDIAMIEDGNANYIFKNKYSLYPRIYQTFWEVDLYLRGGNPGGHSIAQRIEYVKAAAEIIKQNPVIGVGTGDAQVEFNKQYEKMSTKLPKAYWHRAHNQFVTFVITFGFVGGLIILLAMFIPAYYEKGFINYFFIAFLVIAVFSMLNEDTLETQPGVSFFAFFYCFFLFTKNERKKIF